ncbi:hypothetical protein SODALDRAFT_375712 [Sodiomyces alkalinus F11]|uniref:Uncharacterized protein n=1 Tax=Sodiomyces alkalinus (strain CBS 110278 / VKM F-3762 / F11) TaxID=1314773 RepID=A0A3N2Q9W8_SODAK|nr:hypothetical protein SODALDRAFT_375712 [Sodiomyces alkalinus F11]ROT43549.1 hypothetical protein SODALDRAFT_375712 [Sodiomyces alkalinus F11]
MKDVGMSTHVMFAFLSHFTGPWPSYRHAPTAQRVNRRARARPPKAFPSPCDDISSSTSISREYQLIVHSQHFQGLRRSQQRSEVIGLAEQLRLDPTQNPITRRPGPGRGRPKKQQQPASQNSPALPSRLPLPSTMPNIPRGPNGTQVTNTPQGPNPFQVSGAPQGFHAPQGFRSPQGLHPSQISGAPPILQISNPDLGQGSNVSQGSRCPRDLSAPQVSTTTQDATTGQSATPSQDSATLQGSNPPPDSTSAQSLVPPQGPNNPQGANIRQASSSDIPRSGLGSVSGHRTEPATAPAPTNPPGRDTTNGPTVVPHRSPDASSHAPPHQTAPGPAPDNGIPQPLASEEPEEDQHVAKRQKLAPAEDHSLDDEAVLALAAHGNSPAVTYPSPTEYSQADADHTGDLGESDANPFNYGGA